MRGIVLRPDAPHGVRDAVFPGVAAHQVRAVLELLAGVPHGDAAARQRIISRSLRLSPKAMHCLESSPRRWAALPGGGP